MSVVQKRGETFQSRVKHRLLLKPFFATFDTEHEAIQYGVQLETLLNRGILPAELLEPPKRRSDDTCC